MAPFSLRRQANDGLYRVSQDGGAVERVTQVDSSRHEQHLGPHFLPDGRRFLFTVRSDRWRSWEFTSDRWTAVEPSS